MPFISLDFLIFLPIFFAIYWLLKGSLKWQNFIVVAGSYLFYGWADWRYMFLLGGYTLVSFYSGLLLEKTIKRSRRKLILGSVVAINIGVLCLYKYFDFFVNNFNRAFSILGFQADWPTLNLILPIGISFFTFQALSYTIDVYRRKISPTHNAISFFAFLSFFPQMIAGPIERADQLLPQFEHKRTFDYASGVYGMKRILWGMVKKMVIADNCATVVDHIFPLFDQMSTLNLWIGAIFFAIQIYGDFSGYSDIAVGSARLLGINLNENFRMPYFARNIKDFWRRWHITLTDWLRDYVYIPLGGNRKGLRVTILNILIVFVVSGIWHGAEWSYVGWGLYHGCMLVVALLLSVYASKNTLSKFHLTNPASRRVVNTISILFTFLLVMLGFVMFRSHSVMVGIQYIFRMFTGGGWDSNLSDTTIMCLILIAAFFLSEWFSRNRLCPLCFQPKGIFRYALLRWIFFYILTLFTFVFRGGSEVFIYFQF